MTRLVLDANIYINASKEPSNAEQPPCFEIFDFLLLSDLQVVQNDKLAHEWRNGKCDYMLMWQAEMNDRGRLLTYNESWTEEAAFVAAFPEKEKKKIIEDAHVIRLGMVTDYRIISMDNRLRNMLRGALKRRGCPSALKTLHFVVPHNPKVNHDALAWLQRGAPEEPSLQLGA